MTSAAKGITGLALCLALFVGGFYVARRWFPKVVEITVDREVVKVFERLVPGQTVVVERQVPGPVQTQTVRVPFEVIREVRVGVPGPERVVTVTKPVEVPVEVVKERWPQSITVTVGGVRSGGSWYSPDNKELVVGMVTPGVYAVPVQDGWRLESVRTSTVLEPSIQVPLFQRGLTIGARISPSVPSASADVVYRNLAIGGEYSIRVPLGTLNDRPQVLLTWDKRW